MLFLINQTMVDIGFGTSALIAVLGMAVVFFGLILLMAVVAIVGKIMTSSKKEAKPAPAAPAAPACAPASGTAGELKLHNVSPKDAARLMAIVAYKSGKPLNCLRFKSIKEVQQDEV